MGTNTIPPLLSNKIHLARILLLRLFMNRQLLFLGFLSLVSPIMMVGCGPFACSEVGCTSSVETSIGLPTGVLSSSSLPLTVDVCMDDLPCTSMIVDAKPGEGATCTLVEEHPVMGCSSNNNGGILFTRFSDLSMNSDGETSHTIQVVIRDVQDNVLFDETQTVEGSFYYPNGEACGPACYQVSATFQP